MAHIREDGAAVAFPGPVSQDLLRAGWCYSGREGAHVTATPRGNPGWNPYLLVATAEDFGPEIEARLRPYRAGLALADALDGPDPGIELPDGQSLLPFQRAGVLRGLQVPRLLIADEPGLGKTVQAAAIFAGHRPPRTLIVAPASLGAMWVKMLRKWVVDPPLIQHYTSGRHAIHPGCGILVTSYSLAGAPAVQKHEWDMVIADEAHALKSPKAKRTKAVLKLASRAPHFLALTGTPMPNRPREIFEVGKVMNHMALDLLSREAFMDAYDQDAPFGYGNMTGRSLELSARLRCTFMTRRAKRDVIRELPPLSVELIEIDTSKTRAAVKAEKLLDLDTADLNSSIPIDGSVSTVRREMGEAKINPAIQFIRDLIDGGDRVFVLAHHKTVIEAMAEELHASTLTGSTKMADRQPMVDAFASGHGSALVAQMNVGGLGLDGLQSACSVVVIVEPSWVPGDNDQGIDRLFRVGQDFPVRAYMLAAPGSIDERIVSRVVEKARTITGALDSARKPV